MTTISADLLLACLRPQTTHEPNRSASRLATLILSITASAQTILGFTPASAARETEIEEKFKSIPTPDEERRQHRIFTAGTPRRRIEAQQRTRRIHSRRMEEAGTRRRHHPPLRRLRHQSKVRVARNDRAHALSGHPARSSPARRRRLEESRDQRRLARHVDLRRSHRARHLRAQRQSRRLRSAAQERHQRQRQDRPRALLESLQLSRIQSAHRAARRRRRHARLQRSRRKTATRKARSIPTAPGAPNITSSAAPSPTTSWSPAIRTLPDGLQFPARSAFRSKKQSPRRRSWRCRSPGTTPSLCSKTWTARWLRRLARRPAVQVSPRRRPRESPSENRNGQRHPALLRRRRPHPRLRVARRMGRARQSPRRLGLRRRRSLAAAPRA